MLISMIYSIDISMVIKNNESNRKAKIYNLIVRTEFTVKSLFPCDDCSAN
jgi:hypothetical protein